MNKNRKQMKRIREDYINKRNGDVDMNNIQTNDETINEEFLFKAKIEPNSKKRYTEDTEPRVNTSGQIEKERAAKKEIELAENRLSIIKEKRANGQRDVINAIMLKSNDSKKIITAVNNNKFVTEFICLGKYITCIQDIKPDSIDIQTITTRYFINGKPLHILTQLEMDDIVNKTLNSKHNELDFDNIRDMYISSFVSFIEYMAVKIRNHKVLRVQNDITIYDISEFKVTSDNNKNIYIDAIPMNLVDIDILANVFKVVHYELKCNF